MELLHCDNLSKSFGTLDALQGVSFRVAAGEVVGLAGRSGAGKSVLAMILAGLTAPSSGELHLAGRRARWPFPARSYDIRLIPQRPDLADRLDITANIFLGAEQGWPVGGGWLTVPNRRQMDEAAARILSRLNTSLPSLREHVANLSSEQRQIVAIARAIAHPGKLIVADDAAAQLSYAQQQRFLALVREWQQEGRAVILASTNLDHLFAATDRIIVLRQGRVAAELRTDATSREEVVAALVGSLNHQQLTPILWALDGYRQASERAERLRHQQTFREQDSSSNSLTQQLVDQLAQQVFALDSANLALQDAQRRLLTEREQERKALARELHDQVIQDLLSINYELEDIEPESDDPALGGELQEVRESIRTLVDNVRRICGDLRPPTLDSLGLDAAIRSHAREWAARSGIAVVVEIDDELSRLPEEIELSIFRIVQEGLSNVRKYAQASEARIALRHSSPRSLLVSIADNGRGLGGPFDLAALAAEGHYGLLGISERVALLQGKLRIANGEHGGVRLEAEIPHPRVG